MIPKLLALMLVAMMVAAGVIYSPLSPLGGDDDTEEPEAVQEVLERCRDYATQGIKQATAILAAGGSFAEFAVQSSEPEAVKSAVAIAFTVLGQRSQLDDEELRSAYTEAAMAGWLVDCTEAIDEERPGW